MQWIPSGGWFPLGDPFYQVTPTGYCIHICTSTYIFHVFLYTPEIPVNPCMILIYVSSIAMMLGEQENKQKRPVSFFRLPTKQKKEKKR